MATHSSPLSLSVEEARTFRARRYELEGRIANEFDYDGTDGSEPPQEYKKAMRELYTEFDISIPASLGETQ